MTILVTGGAGFIGANFIQYWIQKYPDDFIINFDSLTYAGNLENLKYIEKNPHYTFIKGNITQSHEVDSAMRGIDVVVHFAAESHVDRSILGPQPFVLSNIVGTQVLLDMAIKHNVRRFHHISTDEVYGSLNLKDVDKFTERTCYNPKSPYAASKAGSDHLVRAYHHTYGLSITISNCSNNFGPYQFPEKLIPLAITNLLEGKKVPIYGDGLYVRDWLYVQDHCRAIDLILTNGVAGETYCVGGMTADINNLEVTRRIIKLLGESEDMIEFVKDRPGHDRRYTIDWSKIEKDLGWRPLHDFDAWLEKTVAWYKENRTWWEHIKSGAYKEYYKKQYGTK